MFGRGRTQAVVLRPDGIAGLPRVEVQPAVIGGIAIDRMTNRKQPRAWSCGSGDFRQGDRTVLLPATRRTPVRLPWEPDVHIGTNAINDEVGNRFSIYRSGGSPGADKTFLFSVITFVLILVALGFTIFVAGNGLPDAIAAIRNMLPWGK